MQNELTVRNKLVDKLGYEINDEMTYTKTSKTYANVGSFFKEIGDSYELYKVYTDEELDYVNQLMVMEIYLGLIGDMDDEYASLDMMNVTEDQICIYGLSGSAADTVRSNYLKLGERLNQLLGNHNCSNNKLSNEL